MNCYLFLRYQKLKNLENKKVFNRILNIAGYARASEVMVDLECYIHSRINEPTSYLINLKRAKKILHKNKRKMRKKIKELINIMEILNLIIFDPN